MEKFLKGIVLAEGSRLKLTRRSRATAPGELGGDGDIDDRRRGGLHNARKRGELRSRGDCHFSAGLTLSEARVISLAQRQFSPEPEIQRQHTGCGHPRVMTAGP